MEVPPLMMTATYNNSYTCIPTPKIGEGTNIHIIIHAEGGTNLIAGILLPRYFFLPAECTAVVRTPPGAEG